MLPSNTERGTFVRNANSRVPFERWVTAAPVTRNVSKLSNGSPDNSFPPEGVSYLANPEQQAEVRYKQIAQQALFARNAGKKARKLLEFPTPRITYQRNPTTRDHGSYQRDIWLFTVTWGFRILNDARLARLPSPNPETLADIFLNQIIEHAVTHHAYDGTGVRGSIEIGAAVDLASKAADHCLRDWSPDFIDEMQRRGTVGKRPPTKATLEALAALRALPTKLSRPEQAKRLGVSLRTLDRLRALDRGVQARATRGSR